nr:unnamed protein product [Callosobruchus chinensis]CAH7753521.1 unnamed protein product [Callosobruchus chinensis]
MQSRKRQFDSSVTRP